MHDLTPVASIFCQDLLFVVQLQNIARKAGFVVTKFRGAHESAGVSVLLVNIGEDGAWEEATREAHEAGNVVIAFGPHTESERRARAKAAGANRVLANSNLQRDLPGIMSQLYKSLVGEEYAAN